MRKQMIENLSYMNPPGVERMARRLSNQALDGLCAMLGVHFDGPRKAKEAAICRRAIELRAARLNPSHEASGWVTGPSLTARNHA